MFRRALPALTVSVALVATGIALPATSAVAAKKKAYKVTAKASATTVKTSHSVTIKGKVSPASRKTVKLQRLSSGKWTTIASKKLSKKSAYSFTTNVGKKATTLKYRVTKAKSKKYKAGVSKTLSIKVVTWGTVKAWGENGDGQLGNGDNTFADKDTPTNVKNLTEVTQVAANNNSDTAYALRYDGTVWGWGRNDEKQLGTAVAGANSVTPVRINGISGVKQISAMDETGVALKKDGTVWTWGDNAYGQLGNDTAGGPDSATPVRVKGLTDVVELASGWGTGYALKKDGTVWAWGYGGIYDLGQGGVNTADSDVPVKVIGLPKITDISAIGDTAYAVGPYGMVWAWGYNGNGELGNGEIGTNVSTPATVIGLSGVTRMDGGPFDTAFAIATGGIVWAWGRGASGQLGDGTQTADQPFPVRVQGVDRARATTGTSDTGFVLRADRTVSTFGYWKTTGGVSLSDDVLTPTKIPGLSNVTAIAGGYEAAYAVIG